MQYDKRFIYFIIKKRIIHKESYCQIALDSKRSAYCPSKNGIDRRTVKALVNKYQPIYHQLSFSKNKYYSDLKRIEQYRPETDRKHKFSEEYYQKIAYKYKEQFNYERPNYKNSSSRKSFNAGYTRIYKLYKSDFEEPHISMAQFAKKMKNYYIQFLKEYNENRDK